MNKLDNYGMISFMGVTKVGPFYESILNGVKRSTIREPRKDGRPHVKVGYTTKFYWKIRTPKAKKPIHYIGKAEVLSYEKITLVDLWDDEENAKTEGFANLDEFRDWFFPDWRKHRLHLDSMADSYKQLGRQYTHDLLESIFGKLAPGHKFVDFLTFEYYIIKWEYPLIEAEYVQGSLPDPQTLDW